MEMKIGFPGGLRVDAHFGQFVVQTDQPPDDGGDGTAASPFALFLASLGTCAGFYVLSFCRQRGIPTDGIQLIQNAERDPSTKLVGKVTIDICLPAEFPEKYRAAVIKAADQCTVKKHFQHPPVIEIGTSVAKQVPA
jgi:ribosomal protein S12 methylthiotransferase accessory factor